VGTASVLVKDHTVIVPDLRGMGLSAHPEGGYTKKNQAVDIAGVMDALKVKSADLVTTTSAIWWATRWRSISAAHYAMGGHRCAITRYWQLGHHSSQSFVMALHFRGPGRGAIGAGRERIYLDRFYNELSADPRTIDTETLRSTMPRSMRNPHAMHDRL